MLELREYAFHKAEAPGVRSALERTGNRLLDRGI